MKKTLAVNILLVAVITSCGGSKSNNELESDDNAVADTTAVSDSLLTEDSTDVFEEPIGELWQNFSDPYVHFKGALSDTVYIGPNRDIKSPFDYFTETRSNQFVIIEEGEYIGTKGFWLDEENLIIEGRGKVSIKLDELNNNVMWISGENIVINNLHMTHLQPGETEGNNCTGRVIGFDNADNITIVNCDLNGCGLSGLHDNVGNGTVYAEYNWIHNNSLGAYTDIEGNVWQEETDHPVFVFKNNFIEDNGHGLEEEDHYEEDFHGEH